jgi:hypothetical protein
VVVVVSVVVVLLSGSVVVVVVVVPLFFMRPQSELAMTSGGCDAGRAAEHETVSVMSMYST